MPAYAPKSRHYAYLNGESPRSVAYRHRNTSVLCQESLLHLYNVISQSLFLHKYFLAFLPFFAFMTYICHLICCIMMDSLHRFHIISLGSYNSAITITISNVLLFVWFLKIFLYYSIFRNIPSAVSHSSQEQDPEHEKKGPTWSYGSWMVHSTLVYSGNKPRFPS